MPAYARLGTISSGVSNTTTVDLGEDYGDITLFGWTKDESVQVQYDVDVKPSSGLSNVPGNAWMTYCLFSVFMALGVVGL